MSQVTFASAPAPPVAAPQGMIVGPGGLPGTTTAPINLSIPGVASGWLGEVAGGGALYQNQTDQTLGFNGIRMQCGPAAQNLSRLHSSSSQGGVNMGVAGLLSGTTEEGRIYLEARLALIRTGATDAFHAAMCLCSTFPTGGGFLALYASDVSANWQLAFLSAAGAFNFPFPVPQRQVNTGVPFTTRGLYRVEVVAGVFRALLDDAVIASITLGALTAAEWTVVTGTAAIPCMAQLEVSKAAGADTVDLWIPDGRVKHVWEPA